MLCCFRLGITHFFVVIANVTKGLLLAALLSTSRITLTRCVSEFYIAAIVGRISGKVYNTNREQHQAKNNVIWNNKRTSIHLLETYDGTFINLGVSRSLSKE